MPQSIRTFCISVCVALVAALSLHASAQAQHEVGHSAGWPPVSMVASDDHGHAHTHMAPEETSPEAPDQDQDGQPTGHHHSGVEKPSATPAVSTAAQPPLVRVAEHTLGQSRPLENVGLDGPEYPPKRTRAIL